MAGRAHRVRRWIVRGIVALVILCLVGPFAYTHIAAGEPMLVLPSSTGVPHAGSDPLSLAGPWHATTGSIAGFRVTTGVLGFEDNVTGRTDRVSGALAISGDAVIRAAFTVDLASIDTSASARSLMDVTHYPTATFVLTRPIPLAGSSIEGAVQHYPATGSLTFHGITRPASFTLAEERLDSTLYVLTDIPVDFTAWRFSMPYGVANEGTLEVLLSLSRGAAHGV